MIPKTHFIFCDPAPFIKYLRGLQDMLEDKIETFISCPGGTYNIISTDGQIDKQELPVICAFP